MKKYLSVLSVALLLAVVSSCSGGASLTTSSGMQVSGGGQSSSSLTATVPGTTVVPTSGRYIVMLKDTVTNVPQTATNLTAPFGITPERTYTYALKGFAATLSSQAVSSISKSPLVKEVEPDIVLYAVTPGGGGGGIGGSASQPAQTTPWGISAIGANLNTGNQGSGVSVAIIDTGIYYTHPDLAANYKGGYNAVSPSKTPLDDNGHGTHVSGIVAALNNTIGVVGVAPKAGLVAVKVLNRQGSGYISWIVSGIDWVIANKSGYGGIDVANMSFGGGGTSDALHTAVTNLYNAGVTIAAAAGNSSSDVSGFIPASYPECMAISALNPDNTFAYYSNYGAGISFIAPGTSVTSTWLNGGYKTISGTSMASPHVAGSAALWISDGNLTATPAQVKAALAAAARPALFYWTGGQWPGDPDGIAEPLVYAAGL